MVIGANSARRTLVFAETPKTFEEKELVEIFTPITYPFVELIVLKKNIRGLDFRMASHEMEQNTY
jgi:hypothetical protein